MNRGCLRRRGAWAKVCVVLVLLALWLARAREARASPFTLAETAELPGVVVYPSRAKGERPITVVLHGMCSEPQNACRHFAEQVTATDHLVCPRATKRCGEGGSIWSYKGFVERIELSVRRASAALPDRVDEDRGRTLIGYSLGAFRALDLAQQSAGKYPRVMLIGAKVYPDEKLLRQHGVERLLLSAGAWDMMRDHMERQSRRLARAGFPVRFLELGPVGHFFTSSFADYLPQALEWLSEDEPLVGR